LRREPDPGDAFVAALFVDAAPRMTCPICKEKALVASPADATNTDDWQSAVLCEVCRAPIPPERLEVVPGAKSCARCQNNAEAGGVADFEPEYCPKCGALLETRVSRGAGITRYKRVCTGTPACRL
jgi:hypothetical protein